MNKGKKSPYECKYFAGSLTSYYGPYVFTVLRLCTRDECLKICKDLNDTDCLFFEKKDD